MTTTRETARPVIRGIVRDTSDPSGRTMYVLFNRAMSDDEMRDWHDSISSAALAARPAPQPAADTRVTDAMIVKIWELAQQYDDDAEFMALVRAIIGNATPAPSDKIAEAAIDRCMQEIEDIICEADVSYPAGRDAGTSIDFDRDAVLAALRALAGKGE